MGQSNLLVIDHIVQAIDINCEWEDEECQEYQELCLEEVVADLFPTVVDQGLH